MAMALTGRTSIAKIDRTVAMLTSDPSS